MVCSPLRYRGAVCIITLCTRTPPRKRTHAPQRALTHRKPTTFRGIATLPRKPLRLPLCGTTHNYPTFRGVTCGLRLVRLLRTYATQKVARTAHWKTYFPTFRTRSFWCVSAPQKVATYPAQAGFFACATIGTHLVVRSDLLLYRRGGTLRVLTWLRGTAHLPFYKTSVGSKTLPRSARAPNHQISAGTRGAHPHKPRLRVKTPAPYPVPRVNPARAVYPT